MPTVANPDSVLTFTVDSVDWACQLIDGTLTMPSTSEGDSTPVACGPDEIVKEAGDPRDGQLTGTIFEDTTSGGATRIMLERAGEVVAFTFVKNPGTLHELSISGTLQLAAPPVEVQPGKTARNRIDLAVVTATVAPAFTG